MHPDMSLKTMAEMLCFCLMSNHVHFIIKGTEAECRIFIDEFKRRSSMRLRKKYFEVSPLHGLETSVKQIDINNYLRTAIGYVLRNPLAAGINCMPDAYRWSSCSLYFRHGYSSDKNAGLSHISDFTVKEIWSILGTRVKLPGSNTDEETLRNYSEAVCQADRHGNKISGNTNVGRLRTDITSFTEGKQLIINQLN